MSRLTLVAYFVKPVVWVDWLGGLNSRDDCEIFTIAYTCRCMVGLTTSTMTSKSLEIESHSPAFAMTFIAWPAAALRVDFVFCHNSKKTHVSWCIHNFLINLNTHTTFVHFACLFPLYQYCFSMHLAVASWLLKLSSPEIFFLDGGIGFVVMFCLSLLLDHASSRWRSFVSIRVISYDG